jgi:hypothetical protein
VLTKEEEKKCLKVKLTHFFICEISAAATTLGRLQLDLTQTTAAEGT